MAGEATEELIFTLCHQAIGDVGSLRRRHGLLLNTVVDFRCYEFELLLSCWILQCSPLSIGPLLGTLLINLSERPLIERRCRH